MAEVKCDNILNAHDSVALQRALKDAVAGVQAHGELVKKDNGRSGYQVVATGVSPARRRRIKDIMVGYVACAKTSGKLSDPVVEPKKRRGTRTARSKVLKRGK